MKDLTTEDLKVATMTLTISSTYVASVHPPNHCFNDRVGYTDAVRRLGIIAGFLSC